MEVLAVVLLVFGGVWFFIASLHPYVRCEACNGTGRHHGKVFRHTYRPCHVCSGKGRKQRRAAAFFGIGDKRQSTGRFTR